MDAETGFENDVKMYGTQTWSKKKSRDGLFENDVKMYGTQTERRSAESTTGFENDVKMYGTQTSSWYASYISRLRMM